MQESRPQYLTHEVKSKEKKKELIKREEEFMDKQRKQRLKSKTLRFFVVNNLQFLFSNLLEMKPIRKSLRVKIEKCVKHEKTTKRIF